MNLDDIQKQKVAAWIAEGLTLSQIQNKLVTDLGVTLTYMEVRFLIDDLKLKPKDKEPAPDMLVAGQGKKQPPSASPPAGGKGASQPNDRSQGIAEPESPGGGVSVAVDQITRPGAMVSGKVTFSDGKKAEWHLDQFGRLGFVPAQQGYRPSPQDLQEFQLALQDELQRLGM